jgi:esterase
VQLASRELGGSGPPILILHGLFGSAQNWASVGRRLAGLGRVVALDLRNHGQSPHAPSHSLEDCVADLDLWVGSHARGPVRLVGHSMGGLVAMAFAIAHPRQAAAVAVVDIAPRPYQRGHEQEFAALRTDIGRCSTRGELDALLAPLLPDPAVRQFMLTNAVRSPDGSGFRWRLGVEALASSSISSDFAHVAGSWDGPALFVAGGRSAYLADSDRSAVLRHFPRARIEVIPQADHWPHVSAPRELESLLVQFLALPGVHPVEESSGSMQ